MRIVLAITFPLYPLGARGPVLLAASLTEFLDGFIARKFRWESQLGKLLDPIADKLFFGFTAITFLLEDRLSWMVLLALGVRDIVVSACALGLMLRGQWELFRRMEPRFLGKLATGLQYVALFLLTFGLPLSKWLVGATFLIASAAAVQYVKLFDRSCQSQASPR